MTMFIVFVYFKVPETKNRTFEEIASQFQPGGLIEVEELVDDEDMFVSADAVDIEELTAIHWYH